MRSTRKKSLSSAFFLFRYCEWIVRHYRVVLILSTVVTVAGLFYSVQLYKNLKTDIEELLPENAQSVRDLKAVSNRLTGINHLSVVIETSDVQAGRRFTEKAAQKLSELPTSLVDRVQYNIRSEKEFFSRNKSLYIDLEDWRDIDKYVHDRIRFEKKTKNPFSLGLDDEEEKLQKPVFDFEGLKKKYSERSREVDRFPDGYFESRDGKTHVILVFLPGKVTDIAANKNLSDAAHRIVSELNPKSYTKDMVVGFDGDVQNVVEEHDAIVEDLIKSSVIVSLLVALVLFLYFPSVGGVFALCASVFCGTAVTFGLSYFLVGYLNANTAFLGSIVVGNGINFGIIMLARYFEERRKASFSQKHNEAVLRRSIGYTAQATWTAALAAGFAYASLVITDFRGFSQFGIIGGLGMILCWIAAFVTLPALLVCLENKTWLKIPKRHLATRLLPSTLISLFVTRFSKPIVGITVVSLIGAVIAIARVSKDGFIETDFSKLRSRESLVSGSAYWDDKVNKVFERYLTPTAILASTPEDAASISKALRQIKDAQPGESAISDVKTIRDFLPSEQDQKLEIISNIRNRLSPKILSRLGDDDRKLAQELLPSEESLKKLTEQDIPASLTTGFREVGGQTDRTVLVYPRLGRFWDANEVIKFTEEIRQAVQSSGTKGFIAGQPPLSADMISAILKDGPKATFFAFLAVFILVLIIFPKRNLAGSVIGALLVGVLWMGGVMAALGLKINFLNFIALPITFGIGVDYAVNIVSRYASDKTKSISSAIANTGGAVALCSATTIIGYSSLLIASNQAFVSFGRLAVLGELTCLAAAILVLPATWAFLSRKNKEFVEPPHHRPEISQRI